MNNVGSSNSVVRMDMKSLVSADMKIAAISYTFAATQSLLGEYNKLRFDEKPLYMMIQKSDNQSTISGLETLVIVSDNLSLSPSSLWPLFSEEFLVIVFVVGKIHRFNVFVAALAVNAAHVVNLAKHRMNQLMPMKRLLTRLAKFKIKFDNILF